MDNRLTMLINAGHYEEAVRVAMELANSGLKVQVTPNNTSPSSYNPGHFTQARPSYNFNQGGYT